VQVFSERTGTPIKGKAQERFAQGTVTSRQITHQQANHTPANALRNGNLVACGAHGIPKPAFVDHALAGSAFERFVYDKDEGTARRDKGRDEQAQQDAAQTHRRPDRLIEHAVVFAEVSFAEVSFAEV